MSSVVGFGRRVLAFEAAMARNREIPCKILNSLIKCYFSCFLICDFYHLIKHVIKGKAVVKTRGEMSALESDIARNRGISC